MTLPSLSFTTFVLCTFSPSPDVTISVVEPSSEVVIEDVASSLSPFLVTDDTGLSFASSKVVLYDPSSL